MSPIYKKKASKDKLTLYKKEKYGTKVIPKDKTYLSISHCVGS